MAAQVSAQVPRAELSFSEQAAVGSPVLSAESDEFHRLMEQMFGGLSATDAPTVSGPASSGSTLAWLEQAMGPARLAESYLPPELGAFLHRTDRWMMIVRGGSRAGTIDFGNAFLERHSGPRTLLMARLPRDVILQRFPQVSQLRASPNGLDLIDAVPGRFAAAAAELSPGYMASVPSSSDERPSPPSFLAQLGSTAPDARRMMVVHGWNSLVNTTAEALGRPGLTPPERVHLERVLVSKLQESADGLILLQEEGSTTGLRGIADAVLHLAHHELDERSVNELVIEQIDGVPAQRTSYAFTVARGAFEYVPPLPEHWPSRGNCSMPIADPGSRMVWPGSTSFACTFGPFRAGGVSFIEADPDVPLGVETLLSEPVIFANLRRGSRILMLSDSFGAPERIGKRLLHGTTQAVLDRQFRVVSLVSRAPGDAPLPSYALPLETTTTSSGCPRFPAAEEFLCGKEAAASPAPSILLMDLNATYLPADPANPGTDPKAWVSLLEQQQLGKQVARLVWGQPQDPLTPILRRKASVYLRVQMVRGATVIYGVRPWTPAYLLAPSLGGAADEDPYRLLPAA